MKIGLVGLPGSGKTTCFRVVTGQGAVDSRHGANLANVPIPDPRLDRIFEAERPKKLTYADVTFVDFDAVHTGDASRGELELHKLSGDVDAFALVLQCFGQLDHRGEELDPCGDLQALMLEMCLSDLSMIEKHLEKLAVGPKADRVPQLLDLLDRCAAQLRDGKALRDLALSAEDLKTLRGFAFLTLMPVLVVCNVAEDDIRGDRVAATTAAAEATGLPHIEICAELEEEIAELSREDQVAFLADYGIEEPARARLIRSCFELLDLIVFFTVNDNEARAWTVQRGATAPTAAGKVHTDMEHGFIRAETTPFADLDELGSMKACKDKNRQRVEGKDYVVQDGDILQIRFSR